MSSYSKNWLKSLIECRSVPFPKERVKSIKLLTIQIRTTTTKRTSIYHLWNFLCTHSGIIKALHQTKSIPSTNTWNLASVNFFVFDLLLRFYFYLRRGSFDFLGGHRHPGATETDRNKIGKKYLYSPFNNLNKTANSTEKNC